MSLELLLLELELEILIFINLLSLSCKVGYLPLFVASYLTFIVLVIKCLGVEVSIRVLTLITRGFSLA